MEPLETKRLYLRPLREDDLQDLYALYREPLLMQYITGKPRDLEVTRQRLERHLEDHRRHGFGLCAAILKETGAMIGRCGLEPIQGPTGVEGELAWMFDLDHQGLGLGTEFAQAFIPFVFRTLGLKRLIATADHENNPSIRIMHKCGMRLVSEDQRGVIYEILAEHHLASRQQDS